jgi:hypothetical protein
MIINFMETALTLFLMGLLILKIYFFIELIFFILTLFLKAHIQNMINQFLISKMFNLLISL